MIYLLIMLIIPKTNSNIVLDGILVDSAWKKAYMVSDFKEFIPVYGKKATYRTEAYIFTSSKSIFVGFKCYGPPPVVEHKGRDKIADDYVTFHIAPFGNPSTVFEFSVDAGGNILDSRFNNGLIDASWDTDWKAASHVSDSLYSVEIEIPFKSLEYSRNKLWGINFSRHISKDKSIYYYRLPSPGRITPDMEFVRVKAPISFSMQFIPQIVVRRDTVRDFRGSKESEDYRNLAGDVILRVEGNTFHFTYNPDFADVEADPFTVNISKYPRFLPEKRPFFVYDMDIFQLPFLIGMPVMNFVYTRNIGTDAWGNEIPLKWGMKGILRQGSLKGGFLSVRTDSMEDFLFVRPLYSGRNYEMGVLVGNYTHSDTLDRVISLDTKLERGNYTILFVGAHSQSREGESLEGNFFTVGLKWASREKNISFYYQKIDSLFDINRLGYVMGGGYDMSVRLGRTYYLKKIPYVDVGLSVSRSRDLNELPSVEISPELSVIFKNGHSVMIFGGYGDANKYDPFRDTCVEFRAWNINFVSILNIPPNRVRMDLMAQRVYNFQTGEVGRFYTGNVELGLHVTRNFTFNTRLGVSEGAGLRRTISTMYVGNINFHKKLNLRLGYENVFSESEYYEPYYRYWTFVSYQLGIGGVYLAVSNRRNRSGVIGSVSALKIKYFFRF